MKRLILILVILCLGSATMAAEVTDATGRTVAIPDQVSRVLPAGPPAAVLLAAIAPGQMLGFPGAVSESARDALPSVVENLPAVPRLTASQDQTDAVKALHPDLIIDYGTVSPRYQQLARDTQQRTGIPTLLFDGALDQIPAVARTLGRIVHQPERGETVARVAEAVLALPMPSGIHPRVLYARGSDGTVVAASGTDVTALFARLGWQVVAPDGTGTFRPTDVATIAKLDPDIIILSDPDAKRLATVPAWSGLRAVRQSHFYIAPAEPFGWIEEPPSINRLLGLAWLRGGDPLSLAALFNAAVYDRALTPAQLQQIAGTTPIFKP